MERSSAVIDFQVSLLACAVGSAAKAVAWESWPVKVLSLSSSAASAPLSIKPRSAKAITNVQRRSASTLSPDNLPSSNSFIKSLCSALDANEVKFLAYCNW